MNDDPHAALNAADFAAHLTRQITKAENPHHRDDWRTRALVAEAEVERLLAAIPKRNAEVRLMALKEAETVAMQAHGGRVPMGEGAIYSGTNFDAARAIRALPIPDKEGEV